MPDATLLHALILGVVEGLTEFLPVSSTGHLILAGALLGFNDERGKVFYIAIQTGAMFAVCWEFRTRFLHPDWRLWRNVGVAFLPAALLGLTFGGAIQAHLFHAVPVAIAFIAGGLIILLVERGRDEQQRPAQVQAMDDMSWQDALKVGIAQAFALIPGTSRAGASIIGGMIFGLSRRAATEFSFFLAVPTLVAAGAYDFWRNRALFSAADVPLFSLGSVAAFVSAFLCVRWLLRYIATHDFTPFAWYRIVFGALVLLSWHYGWADWRAG